VSIEVWPFIRADAKFQIADFRFHIWDLRFTICHPEGHAFVPEGLRFDRSFTAINPG
jgi:hypothetical protein